MRNVILLTREDDDLSDVAKNILQNRQIKFAEVSLDGKKDYGLQRHTSPTLLVYGRPYVGVDEIKQAIYCDQNVR